MCVPPWAKEGQTNCLDDSGCHSTPVQISVIVSLRGGWASCEQGPRGTAEGVGWKLLWSERSRRCSCLYYLLYNLPGRALWRWERGQSAKWKRGSFFFRLLFRVPHPQAARRQRRSDGTNSPRFVQKSATALGCCFSLNPVNPLRKDFVSLCSSFTIRYYHLFIDPLRVYYGTGGGPKWIVWVRCDAPWHIIIHASRGPRGEVHRWVKDFTVASVEIDAETAGLPEQR